MKDFTWFTSAMVDQDVLTPTSPGCDALYLDYNCLIHYVLNHYDYSKISEIELEEQIITQIFMYTRKLVNSVVKPTKLLYIAMDGTVPNVKLCKNRDSSYKKQFDEHIERGLGSNPPRFNSNAVAPGTQFMEKLHDRIRGMIGLKTFSMNVCFSDSNEVGEGAVKIFTHIREMCRVNGAQSVVIYGTSFDLFVLCMVNDLTIHLCQEDDNGKFKFLHTLSCVVKFFDTKNLLHRFKTNPKKILLELVLVLMFGGNDYVHPLYFTRSRGNGIELLLQEFSTDTYNLVNLADTTVCWSEVYRFLSKVAEHETSLNSSLNESHTTPDVEDGIQFYRHGLLSDERHVMHKAYTHKLIVSTYWKPEYYQNVIGVDYSERNIDEVCNDYMNSIMWYWDYHVNGAVASWTYCYAYNAAPSVSDLMLRMTNHQPRWYFKTDEFDGSYPSAFTQLLTVLPRTNHHFLPECFRTLCTTPSSPIASQYPQDETKIDFDLSSNKMTHARPILPKYNVMTNQHFVNLLRTAFTDDELKRDAVK